MTAGRREPLLRRRWWSGVLIGLILPLALVPASLQLMRWAGHREIVANAEGIAWVASAAVGVFLTVRPWLVALPVAVIYAFALGAALQVVQLGMSCTMLGGYACP